MQATSRKDASRKSAEWTGFLATTTATAVASARTAKTTKAQPAPPVRSTPSVTPPPHPCSTTVKGLTLGALRQSVSLRMSRYRASLRS